MEIIKTKQDGTLNIKIIGAINTVTAPEIEKATYNQLNDVHHLIIDLEKVDYISSAGLRVLTSLKFEMNKNGGNLEIVNINDIVNDVFEITNFYELLGIEH